MSSIVDYLRLARTEQVGPKLFRRLLDNFGSAEAALEELPRIASNARRSAPNIPKVTEIEREIAATTAYGAGFLTWEDEAYPQWLRAIPDAPPVLVYQGGAILLAKPCVALVGARSASQVSAKMAGILASDLGKAGYVTVSGLARGIDAAVHQASVATGTIGVIAGGIDHIYPKENAKLYSALAEKGLILTEAPIGTAPRAEHFPRRNRIISGLSLGVVVVEAAARSGSLITARLAGEQGREVMAVPGFPLDPRAEGTNKLLKQGAALIESAEDIVQAVSQIRAPSGFAEAQAEAPWEQLFETPTPDVPKTKKAEKETAPSMGTPAQILAALQTTPITVDSLQAALSMPTAELLHHLLLLELEGKVFRAPGDKVARVG